MPSLDSPAARGPGVDPRAHELFDERRLALHASTDRNFAILLVLQWLAALATHWSESPRRRIGDTLVDLEILPSHMVEEAADGFHDGLDVVEVRLSA